MKSIQTLKLVFLAAVVGLAACAKDKDKEPEPTTPTPPAAGPFVAKVDNQAFPTANLQFTTARFVTTTKMLQITGQPADRQETIVLTLAAFEGKVATAADWKPGTYDFDPAHVTELSYLASAEYNKWNGSGYEQWFTNWDYVKAGKITIESNSGTHIKGTFSFDAVRRMSDGTYDSGNVRKITEGAFDLDIAEL